MQNWKLERTQRDLDILLELGVIRPCGSDYKRTRFGQSIPAVPCDATGDELIEWVEEQRRRLAVRVQYPLDRERDVQRRAGMSLLWWGH
jgi:hypothetical protein